MAKQIRTKDNVRDVKVIDKASALKDKIKVASVKAKAEAKETARSQTAAGMKVPTSMRGKFRNMRSIWAHMRWSAALYA